MWVGCNKKNVINNPNADQQQSHILSLASMLRNLCFLPLQTLQTMKNTTGLSLKKFLSFWCFDSRYVVFWS